MYGTDEFTGFFGKIKKQLLPTFAPTPTNINPHKRTGTMPRLRHFKKKGTRRLFLPANRYSVKELAAQKLSVAFYHKMQDPKLRKRFEGRARAEQMQAERKLQEEFKANKPVLVGD